MPASPCSARRVGPAEAARRPIDAPAARPRRPFIRPARLALAGALAAWGAAASAEAGFGITLASDDRFRGESTSGERPVATATLSYDDRRGPYAGATLTLVATRRDGVQPLRSIQYLGYARRMGSGIALDLGVAHRVYSQYYAGGYARNYAEIYVGASGPRWSTHLFVAPSYEGRKGAATYGELNALLLSRGEWSVTGHLGLLAPPGRGHAYSPDPVLDWRLGVTRRVGEFGLSLDWVGASPGGYPRRGHGGLVLSASRSF